MTTSGATPIVWWIWQFLLLSKIAKNETVSLCIMANMNTSLALITALWLALMPFITFAEETSDKEEIKVVEVEIPEGEYEQSPDPIEINNEDTPSAEPNSSEAKNSQKAVTESENPDQVTTAESSEESQTTTDQSANDREQEVSEDEASSSQENQANTETGAKPQEQTQAAAAETATQAAAEQEPQTQPEPAPVILKPKKIDPIKQYALWGFAGTALVLALLPLTVSNRDE